MKKFNELYRPSEQGVTYERYCGILDEILVEQLQEQGGNWWCKLSPD